MRKSTQHKLFREGEVPHLVLQFDVGSGAATMFVINGHTAIVQEFENEADGFEVYVAVPGNSIDACRIALGFPPPVRSVGALMDEDAGVRHDPLPGDDEALEGPRPGEPGHPEYDATLMDPEANR